MAKTPEFDLREQKKNYIINGDMSIAQRGTSFAALGNTQYTVDRFQYIKVGAMIHTVTQDTDVPTLAQAGHLFTNSLRLNLTTPDTSIAAGDFAGIGQIIEGYNWKNLAQKPFTIGFWVKATLAGTYCIGMQNSAADRGYAAEYVINSPNTWEYKTVTVPASVSAGTWNYSSGVGLKVWWMLAVGSTFQFATGSWQTGTVLGTANQVNGVNTGATDFRLTGITINEGNEAMSFSLFAGDHGAELTACQRYFWKSYSYGSVPGVTGTSDTLRTNTSAAGLLRAYVTYGIKIRTPSPTVTIYNPNTGATGSIVVAGGNVAASMVQVGDTSVSIESAATSANADALFHITINAELT